MTDGWIESLHFNETPKGARFAVVTRPVGPASGVGVLLCSGGWFAGNWSLNRLYVNLARDLATAGHTVVRFDWEGTGESPGYIQSFRLDEPFLEDVYQMAALLSNSERVVAAGICFGASSLLSAANQITNLSDLVLISVTIPGSGPSRVAHRATLGAVAKVALRPSVLRGWFDPYTRRLYLKWFRARKRTLLNLLKRGATRAPAGKLVPNQILALLQRGVSVRFLYGRGNSSLSAFSTEPFASIAASDLVRIEVIDGDVGSSSSKEDREAISRVITDAVSTRMTL